MNNLKVYFLFGVPASGKSTIMRELVTRFMPLDEFKYGKLCGLTNGRVSILGTYGKGTFDGTDRLPNDVITDAIKYIEDAKQNTYHSKCLRA